MAARYKLLTTLGLAIAGLTLGLVWLTVLTFFDRLPALPATLFVAAVGGTFVLLHAIRCWPSALDHPRLHGLSKPDLAPALALLLCVTGLQVTLFVLIDAPHLVPATTSDQGTLFLLVAILIAPIIEEFAFRGWFQTQLERIWHPLAAIVLATAIFTLIHGTSAWYSHALSGFFYGFALWRSGSVWLVVLLHAASNAVIALLDTHEGLREVLRYWAQNGDEWGFAVAVAWSAASVIAAAYWWRLPRPLLKIQSVHVKR